VPASHQLLGALLDEHDPAALDVLATYSPLCVIVDRRLDLDGAFRAYLERHGLPHVATDWEYEFYVMQRRPAQSFPGRPVPIASVAANANPQDVVLMRDGDINTAWATGTSQRGDEQLVITLAEPATISGVALSLGPRIGDYPRTLAVETSADGVSWQEAFRGSTSGAALKGVLTDPLAVPVVVPFAATRARMIRLRQLAESSTAYWSVAEVTVLQ